MIISGYFSRQIWASFAGFSLVLGGLAWMVQILLLMKLIIKYGVDIGGFVGMSVYTIPMLLGIITPFVVFISVMFVYGKMIEQNEIPVLSACGMSPVRIGRPALMFAIVIMILNYGASLWLIPKTQDMFYSAQWELRYGIGHLKLRESSFNQMTNGVVIYVEQVNQKDLIGLVMRDARNPGDERLITSEYGKLINTPNGLSIVMGAGALQMGGKSGVMMGTFDGAQMDLEMNDAKESELLRARRVSTGELMKLIRTLDYFRPPQKSKIVSEAATRFLSPLMGLIFVLIAMACLLKTTALRRRASFAGFAAAIAMISSETLFMTVSASASTIAELYCLGAGQLVLIAALTWYLCKK
ncbi:MAG: LptF/LptG family permease [Rickettsiales bacterium]|jgi:lipopolysaccharide export system permease protein|nr:LptF/LptG family permease [Rickettsiales bacterium]